MPASSRVGDLWTGICCCHPPYPCIPMGGYIVVGSPDIQSTGSAQGRLSSLTVGFCGHPGTVVSGSPTVLGNNLQKATIGSTVTGCNIGTVVTGSPSHIVCFGGGSFQPVAYTEFQGRVIVHTEVDFGNKDDDPDSDDGLNIYPPIPTDKNGNPTRPPTAEEIARSASLDASPTTEVSDSTSGAQIAITPPTSCLDVTAFPPDNFQLSTNFILSDVSTKTAISKRRVKAQAGLTVEDIVCNLQGWAENVGEALSTQYGRNEMIITSGFRPGTGKSQHERGQATDIQFPNMNNEQVYNVAVWMNENVPYDQLILEYGGNNPWIHSSFNRGGNRPATAGNKFGTRKSPGNYVWGTLLNMV
jgi:hypothetical protein